MYFPPTATLNVASYSSVRSRRAVSTACYAAKTLTSRRHQGRYDPGHIFRQAGTRVRVGHPSPGKNKRENMRVNKTHVIYIYISIYNP